MKMNEEKNEIIRHEWLQIFVMCLTVSGLFLWTRAESKSDWRHMDAQIQAIREDSKSFRDQWALETKDFHGRLCAIEERNKK
jgi:hypothetical protein